MIYSGEMNMDKDPFKEYLRESEPNKATKGYVWSTAVGLQAVDGLKPSQYLIDTAIQNIEGKITLKEAQSLIESYYNERPVRVSDNERTEEADKVSSRIAELLSETAFSFSPNEYIAIHRKLFRGIYKHAGKIRDYNITKKEWVLDGATVVYGSASELRATLEYDFSQVNMDKKQECVIKLKRQGASVRQLSRITGLSKSMIGRICVGTQGPDPTVP